MNVVIDDHLLREVLLDKEPAWLRRTRRRGDLLTTGSWYYRLCGALQAPDLAGSLSGPVAELPAELRAGVIERVAMLPGHITLLSLRELAWRASGLGRRHGLNLLGAEALGAAIHSACSNRDVRNQPAAEAARGSRAGACTDTHGTARLIVRSRATSIERNSSESHRRAGSDEERQ